MIGILVLLALVSPSLILVGLVTFDVVDVEFCHGGVQRLLLVRGNDE